MLLPNRRRGFKRYNDVRVEELQARLGGVVRAVRGDGQLHPPLAVLRHQLHHEAALQVQEQSPPIVTSGSLLKSHFCWIFWIYLKPAFKLKLTHKDSTTAEPLTTSDAILLAKILNAACQWWSLRTRIPILMDIDVTIGELCSGPSHTSSPAEWSSSDSCSRGSVSVPSSTDTR